jgi:hypothetical protein
MMREARENCHNDWQYQYYIDPETGEQQAKVALQPGSWVADPPSGYSVTISRAPFLSYDELNTRIEHAMRDAQADDGPPSVSDEERERREQREERIRAQQEAEMQRATEDVTCVACGDTWARYEMRWFENDDGETICGYCNRER